MFDFGLRIRELRTVHNMSQEDLGQRINRTKSVISSYENNIKTPPLDVLTDIAAVFNVSLDYLVGFDKARMISVDKLNDSQAELVQTIVFELSEKSYVNDGLSARQQLILNSLLKEFAKK